MDRAREIMNSFYPHLVIYTSQRVRRDYSFKREGKAKQIN